MPMRLSPRGSATKQRLRKYFNENPKFSNADFVRTALQVGEDRGLRTWPSLNSGQQSLGAFKNDDDSTLQIWGMNLIEATLDKLEGLRFDTGPPQDETVEPTRDDLDRDRVAELVTHYVTEETLGNILANFKVEIINTITDDIRQEVFEGAPSNGSDLRERYANTLLKLLETDTSELPEILNRLDKLVGLS